MASLGVLGQRFGVAALLCMAAACSAEQSAGDLSGQVKPADFALVPCSISESDEPCALVMAGGKRILMGAPAGVGKSLDDETLGNLDAVMLFSLRAEHIEGLDEVRNRSWRLGRDVQLKVIGPDGTKDVVEAINRAFEVSDAELFLEDRGAGGFNAPLLVSVATEPATRAEVFNTGDLSVMRIVNTHGQAGYWVDYGGKRALLEPCGMDQAGKFAGGVDISVNCGEENAHVWPLEKVAFVTLDGN